MVAESREQKAEHHIEAPQLADNQQAADHDECQHRAGTHPPTGGLVDREICQRHGKGRRIKQMFPLDGHNIFRGVCQ